MDGGFNATHQAIMPVFPKLTEAERTRSTFALVPPTLCLGTAPDQAFFFLVRPKDPNSVDIEIGHIFHPSALDDPLFEHKLKLTDVAVQVFVDQDTDAATKVQRILRLAAGTPDRRRATYDSTVGWSSAIDVVSRADVVMQHGTMCH